MEIPGKNEQWGDAKVLTGHTVSLWNSKSFVIIGCKVQGDIDTMLSNEGDSLLTGQWYNQIFMLSRLL